MTGHSADVIVVEHGLAGLVATCEIVDAGKSVLSIDQQGPADIGGQAYWSFGGLFMVNTPEQRCCGISDNRELTWQDWVGSAQFSDGDDDSLGAAMGPALRGFRRRRETSVVARAGLARLPDTRLAGAGRPRRTRVGEQRAQIPHHLGDWPATRRRVRPPGRGRRGAGACHTALPAPGRRARRRRRPDHRYSRHDPRTVP
jgi:predicted oxidoreductase